MDTYRGWKRSPLPPSLPLHGQPLQTAEPLEEVGRELGQGVVIEPPVPAFHPDRQIASQSVAEMQESRTVASGRVSE